MTTPSVLATGTQYEISGGEYSAVITEVGATLRYLARNDHELIKSFPADQPSPNSSGQQLLPWPNRVRDGRWTWRGVEQQLPINEPQRHNALHGLVRWLAWELVSQTTDSVTQRVRLRPQEGWPATMAATITHRLDADGLSVEVRVSNPGQTDLPFGYGVHPYLSVGERDVNDVIITAPAARYLAVDPQRLLPIDVREVDEERDLRQGRQVSEVNLDHAFTDLATNQGRWEVRCELGDRSTTLWAEQTFSWLQIFTGGGETDWGLAVEPMTCGPDAFNPGPTHDGLITLAPGDGFAGRWGIYRT